jgi:MOSC domain-containing protein YiiM
MATNPCGKGTKTIGINMKMAMATELERRASSMGLSTGAYCKIILGDWIKTGKKLKLQES